MLRALVLLALVAAPAFGALCASPVVEENTVAVGDPAMFKNTIFTSTFSIKCDDESVVEEVLYASVNGKFIPVSYDESGNYQVSWSIQHSEESASSAATVQFFDAAGFEAANGDASATGAFSIDASFSAPLNLQLPLKPQFLALVWLAFLFYMVWNK
eukprot:m.5611 g.5611  ORF g.5611 m.5611 type:complete len:157 (+) comp5069_c0_seq1:371-841(+)